MEQTRLIIVAGIAVGLILASIVIDWLNRRLAKSFEQDRMTTAYWFLINRIEMLATPDTHYCYERDIITFNNEFTGTRGSSVYYTQLKDALYNKMVAMIPVDECVAC